MTIVKSSHVRQEKKSLQFAYRDLKKKKKNFNKHCIHVINSTASGMGYSKFKNHLKINNIRLNNKMLKEIIITTPQNYSDLFLLSE